MRVVRFFIDACVLCASAALGLFFLTNATAAGSTSTVAVHATTAQSQATLAIEALPPVSSSSNALNWAGYVAQGGSYTSVSGSWVVPTVAATSNGADATWVGIGGVESHDLIQAGTEALPDNSGNLVYQAWYELLPSTSRTIALAVKPGDSVSVSITEESAGTWLISFRDNTTGKSYTTTQTYNSWLSSAEWIEELPVAIGERISLDQFGSVGFSSGYTIHNGQAQTIQEAGAQPLTMLNAQGEMVATPSVLGADGGSFAIARDDASATPLSVGRTFASAAVSPNVSISEGSGSQPTISVRRGGRFGRFTRITQQMSGGYRVITFSF